jgi:hypothetical protein
VKLDTLLGSSLSAITAEMRRLRGDIETKADATPKAATKKQVEQMLEALDSFDWEAWEAELSEAYEGPFKGIVTARAKDAAGRAWEPDDPFMRRELQQHVGTLIKELPKTTKAEVTDIIQAFLERGEGAGTTADLATLVHDTVTDKFADYQQWRADRVARTETGYAYNHGTVFGLKMAGVKMVQVLDGSSPVSCPECKAANGQVWTLAKALANALEHPNCERDFVGDNE